jgi:hypothetical protein
MTNIDPHRTLRGHLAATSQVACVRSAVPRSPEND